MRIAFIIYDNMTSLDFIGVYDPLTRLKTMNFVNDLEYDVCALTETIISYEGLKIKPNKIENDLSGYEYVIVPGGNGIKDLLKNQKFLDWIRTVSQAAIFCGICGGSLLLGAVGKLKGKKATTHPSLMNFLKNFTDKASNSRICEDGNIITARGVTSSIDLGLYLCEKIAGKEVMKQIQSQMDYLNYTIS